MDAALEDDLEGWVYESEISCSSCGDKLGYGEESYLLQVVTIKADYGPMGGFLFSFEPVVDHNEDYVFGPHFLEVSCWESEKEDVHLTNEGAEVHKLELPQHEVCQCAICQSSITSGELVGVAHLGEVTISDKSPDGEDALEYEIPDQMPDVVCASCLYTLNENVTEYWEEAVQQDALADAGALREQWALATTG